MKDIGGALVRRKRGAHEELSREEDEGVGVRLRGAAEHAQNDPALRDVRETR